MPNTNMKMLNNKQVYRIQSRVKKLGGYWHEGISGYSLFRPHYDLGIYAYWVNGKSYIWHKWGSLHWYCMTKSYYDGVISIMFNTSTKLNV